MNKQLIQAILYANIMAAQGKNLDAHMVDILDPATLTLLEHPINLKVPDISSFPPPLTHEELLEVLVGTISDVLKLYTRTTFPVGPVTTPITPGVIGPGASLMNILL